MFLSSLEPCAGRRLREKKNPARGVLWNRVLYAADSAKDIYQSGE
jgi:hypothetical protein